MRTRVLVLAAGSALSLVAAGAAAQTTTTDPNRTRSTAQPGQSGITTGTADAESILRDLVGVWKVDVTVHDPAWWDNKKGMKRGTDPAHQGRNDPNHNDPSRSNPDASRPSNVATGMNDNLGGVTRSSMFGSILRSHTVLADGPLDTAAGRDTDASAPSRDRSAAASLRDDGLCRKLSFLSFDKSTRQYSAVFMDDKSGEIEYRTGSYDAGARRIVFNSRGGHGADRSLGWESGDPGRVSPSPGAPGQRPGDTTGTTPGADPDRALQPGRPDGETAMAWRGNKGHRVVLEILDSNSHRVTMYEDWGFGTGSPTSTTTPTTTTPASPAGGQPTPTPGTPSSTPGSPSTTPGTPGSPATTTPPSTPGTTTSQPSTGEFGRILYEATYSRLTATDEAKYRSWIDKADTADKADKAEPRR